MPKIRPTTALTNLGRQSHGSGGYLTDCKLCREGIYQGQPSTWLTKPMGLSHDECIRREDE